MCMCVYACECSVHRDQKGRHPQIEWQLWDIPPAAGAWPPSSVRATCALNGLAIFLPSQKVIFTLWVRVHAYHSLYVKVRWWPPRVRSLYCELQALNSGHQVHGKRVYLLKRLEGPGHKHLNDHFNDRKKMDEWNHRLVLMRLARGWWQWRELGLSLSHQDSN